jgi:hypothetical protein
LGFNNIKEIDQENYANKIEGDIAVFYGLKDNLKKIFNDYKKRNKISIFIDLGYFKRTLDSKFDGYHRISINHYYPMYCNTMGNKSDIRLRRLDVKIKEKKTGGENILVAGMSKKSAWALDLDHLHYEQNIVDRISKITSKRIVYRSKPTCVYSRTNKIQNAESVDTTTKIFRELNKCSAVVTHHSNVAIDALINGMPAYVDYETPQQYLCFRDLNEIDNPYFPSYEEIHQFLCNLAYCQWNDAEIRNGSMWRFIFEQLKDYL